MLLFSLPLVGQSPAPKDRTEFVVTQAHIETFDVTAERFIADVEDALARNPIAKVREGEVSKADNSCINLRMFSQAVSSDRSVVAMVVTAHVVGSDNDVYLTAAIGTVTAANERVEAEHLVDRLLKKSK